MVVKVVGHYGTALQIHHRLTQGDLQLPTIFNVFFDTVIRQWVTVVGRYQEGAGQEGLVKSIQALLALFYFNDSLVVSPKSARLQEAFNALTSLFDHLSRRINKGNTVIMACRSCHTLHARLMDDYNR